MHFATFSTGSALRLPRPGTLIQALRARPQDPAKTGVPVDEILSAYGLAALRRPRTLPGAWRNETWLVLTPQGGKVLKRYKTELPQETIVHEHSILTHLNRKDFPAPRLLADLEGNTLHTHGDRLYALTDYLEGYYRFPNYIFLPDRSINFCFAVGQTLGRLHWVLDGFEAAGRPLHGFDSLTGNRFLPLGWYVEKIDNTLKIANRSDPINTRVIGKLDWVKEQYACLETSLNQAGLRRGLIHGDFGPNNLMVRSGYPIMVLDFELARIEWRLSDLIEAFAKVAAYRDRQRDLEKIRRMMLGYLDIWPEQADSLQYIPQLWQFIALRRMVLAWSLFNERKTDRERADLEKRMERLEWISQNEKELASLSPR